MKKVLKYFGISICLVALHASFLAPRVEATPMKFGDNYYEFILVSDPLTGTSNSWATASADGAASVYNGLSGHLATITSQAENDFLYSLVPGSFSGFMGAWLGGKAPEGWLVGPEAGQGFIYTNWGGVEPNNAGYAHMNIGTFASGTYSGIASGTWADDSFVQGVPDPTYDPVIGYFVEYEGVAPIPEPATMLLLGSGLIGLWGFRKKFKN